MKPESFTLEQVIEKLNANSQALKNFQVKRIGIFGSCVKGTQTEESDIDFLVEFEKPSYSHFISLATFLENLFGKKVDLLTPSGLESIRISEVKEEIKKSLVYVKTE